MTFQRIERAVLLQGPLLVEVAWVLRRGAREIWKTDSITPSPAITQLLRELEAVSRSGSAELPQVDDQEESTSTDHVTTEEAARMLGIGARQVRNLGDRLGRRKVGGVVTLDRAAVQAEAARRADVA